MTRVTGLVTELKDNEVFVFGSNEAGRHGKGAAKTAKRWGAIYGQAEGMQGRTYGIPTVDADIRYKLSLGKIRGYVDVFIDFAKASPERKFLVTEIGCGLAGWTVREIAPMFEAAIDVENIYLPKSFWDYLIGE